MEILDICDHEGKPTGQTAGRNTVHEKGLQHRTAHVWIVREKDGVTEVLMQRRSPQKESYPDLYDTSSAGHIPAGDEPRASAVRELREELGIEAAQEDLIYLGKFHGYCDAVFHGRRFIDNEVTFVYLLSRKIHEDQIIIQEEEISCVDWFSLDEVYMDVCRGSDRFCPSRKGLEVLREGLKRLERC
jgi:isopentenyldiphosphate isomerase